MPRRPLPRTLALCAILALPAALSACVNEATPPPAAAPIDYSAYSKLPLNVASIDIEQRYFASGQPPDVSADDPINPVSALRQMAQERLQAAGAAGRAVFSIDNASVIDQDGELIGAASVTLSIIDARGARVGYAEASVTRQLVGFGSDLRGALYSLTTALMQQMNVEFENQVRRSLGPWLLASSAVPAPVQQVPLQPGAPPGVIAAPPAPAPYPSYQPAPPSPAGRADPTHAAAVHASGHPTRGHPTGRHPAHDDSASGAAAPDRHAAGPAHGSADLGATSDRAAEPATCTAAGPPAFSTGASTGRTGSGRPIGPAAARSRGRIDGTAPCRRRRCGVPSPRLALSPLRARCAMAAPWPRSRPATNPP